MLQSKLFTKTRKEVPADEVSKNAKLLIRAGFVYKEMAGVYAYLPLGLKVLEKITKIIREEMNAIGGQEVVLTALQQKETWEPTNQWDDKQVDVWFKTELKNGTEIGLAVTHEPPITKMMKESISSYRDLPQYVYQFQTKFRNETRAKSGIMRTREFVMKDLYSFSKSLHEHNDFYREATQAYEKIFRKVGLGDYTYMTLASGGMFSKVSHEFQTITDAGEDIIYIDEEKKLAVNKEVVDDVEIMNEAGFDRSKLVEKKAVEVGNIFTLGTRFSDALGLKYKTEEGGEQPVFMGSYGIGPARLMGTIVEVLSDDRGIIWPESVAPFKVHLLTLTSENSLVEDTANALYKNLQNKGIEVLYDERKGVSAGEKFADSDLIGIPYRVVVSDKSLSSGGVEIKERNKKENKIVSADELVEMFLSKKD